jgi:hypothetical protein
MYDGSPPYASVNGVQILPPTSPSHLNNGVAALPRLLAGSLAIPTPLDLGTMTSKPDAPIVAAIGPTAYTLGEVHVLHENAFPCCRIGASP